MFNYYLLIIWLVLILGTIGTYRLGKEQWGIKGSLLLSVGFISAVKVILRLLFNDDWLGYLLVPWITF